MNGSYINLIKTYDMCLSHVRFLSKSNMKQTKYHVSMRVVQKKPVQTKKTIGHNTIKIYQCVSCWLAS